MAMKRLLLLVATAALVLPAGAAGAATRTVDLASGQLDGHRILGRTVAGVTAALGRPDFRAGPRSRYVIGWGDRRSFQVEVIFRPAGGVERAWSIAFERDVRDVKIGDLLGRSSASFQTAVNKSYAGTFRLVRPYACTSKAYCVGEFAPRIGSLHLTFGTQPQLGTWLTIWQVPAA
jgi:hypothetical protein